jgi:putative hydrolase of the HAD superfamily
MTTAVLFDFYGTIASASTWPETPQDVLARHGYALSAAIRELWQRENRDGLDHHEHSVSRSTYEAWERGRLTDLVRACGVPAAAVDVLIEEMWRVKRPPAITSYPEAREVLDRLRDLGLVVGLCSNWGWDLEEAVAEVGLAGQFDVVVSSAHAGARKPHPRIFEYALAQCGAAAGDVVFVGDTIVPDVLGPLSAGMACAHVRRAEPAPWPGLGTSEELTELASEAVPDGVHRLTDLWGVLDVVGSAPKLG